MKPVLWLLAVPLLLCGCSDGSPSAPAGPATITGRLLDDRGDPVANASIELAGSALQVSTDARGRFRLEVEAGSHMLRACFNDLTICEACFRAERAEMLDLGDLYPGRDSGCGRPWNCPGDADCDGLSDADELEGWEITIVQGNLSEITRMVYADPGSVDTDRDGLTDAEEYAAGTDPGRRDTDGDSLADFCELNSYKSNPWMVDSDGDSRGPDGDQVADPNLWDGYELLLTKTSPTLADTDGDGLTDWEEVHSGGTDPLVADLPRMALDLHGDPTIILNVTDVEKNESKSIMSTLEKETDNYEHSDSESTKMSIDNTVKIHTETSAGTASWIPSFEAKITTDTEFKHGYATESLSSWTETSVRESKQNYEDEVSKIQSINYDDGMLWTGIKIVNNSNLAFRVGDLRITAYRLKPGGSFAVIGNLRLGRLEAEGWEPLDGAAGEFTLGPSAEYVDLVGADQLPAQVMRALVSNPTALLFEIGSYTLHTLDDTGSPSVNFATLGESVIQRTGLIVIDYGNGVIERHMVATNVYRSPDGTSRGLKLGEALDLLGVTHATVPRDSEDPESRRVLTAIGNVATYVDEADAQLRGFWIVGGTGSAFDAPVTQHFDDILIRTGERINLTYVEDSDGDLLFDREEYLLGIDAMRRDSDRDELSDYEESKLGWLVTVDGESPYEVFSDPRFADRDNDYLLDGAERSLGTDPYEWDTDGDGLEDGFDPYPLSPPCISGSGLLLSAWWNGEVNGATALDIWEPGTLANHGTMSDLDIAASPGAERMFMFNTPLSDPPDLIDIPDPPAGQEASGLSPVHEFSLSMRMRWIKPPSNVPPGTWGTVLTKGPRHRATYALSVDDSGNLRFSAYRRVFHKKWGWLFGWVDNLSADLRFDSLTELNAPDPLPNGEWAHVVATFGRDYMTLYVDGVQVDRADMDTTSTSGNIKTHSTTERLNPNSDPLRLGADLTEGNPAPEGRFNGYLDDLQYFHRALTPTEVTQLHALGVCRPN